MSKGKPKHEWDHRTCLIQDRCSVCGGLIKKGEPIYLKHDDSEIVHEQCYADAGTAADPRQP